MKKLLALYCLLILSPVLFNTGCKEKNNSDFCQVFKQIITKAAAGKLIELKGEELKGKTFAGNTYYQCKIIMPGAKESGIYPAASEKQDRYNYYAIMYRTKDSADVVSFFKKIGNQMKNCYASTGWNVTFNENYEHKSPFAELSTLNTGFIYKEALVYISRNLNAVSDEWVCTLYIQNHEPEKE